MIEFIENGDIFKSSAEVLVNPVNTAGVMGKGLALQFKFRYPSILVPYQKACKEGKLKIGKLQLLNGGNKFILNFPTKEDWSEPSRLEYIDEGLKKFALFYKDKGIKKIAFPKLGAGLGGLDWKNEVKPLMIARLAYLQDIDIEVYE